MDDFATFASIVAIAAHVTGLVKYASAGDVRSVVAGVIPMVTLFFVLLVAGEADATSTVLIPGINTPLGDLDVASLCLVSLAGGSVASKVYDFQKAHDNSDSAAEPKLGETSFVDHSR